MQAYSNPKRENDPHSLPDVEVFHHDCTSWKRSQGECIKDDEGDCLGSGWYWWTCLPGCLPDSEPNGPFATREEALADAQDCDNEPEEMT